MHLTTGSAVPSVVTVAVDVSAYKLNLMCRELSAPGASAEWEIASRTEAITSTLRAIWERAQAEGKTNLLVVVEPTGIYHKLLLRIAAALGFETGMVDAGHVKKMRSVLFGDDGAMQRSRITDLHARDLAFAWEDFELASRRRQNARRELEALYDEARRLDPLLPDLIAGSVVSKLAMARFLAEAGPLGAYTSWRQLLRMAGANLRERKSGKYVGQTRIARAGRPALRAVMNQMALPLVKRDRLFGPYYHHKTGVEKMPGAKAMTAVGRKIVKMIWGWYRSGAAFDARRVFTCRGELRHAA